MYKLFGLRVDETLEINLHQSYLLEQKPAFMTEFTAWFAEHGIECEAEQPLLNDGVYEAFINSDDQDGFYSALYYQSLAWHAQGFSLSRVFLLLSECRQLFVLMSERKNNHRLAKALCRVIDLAQAIVSNVYQMYETLQHLKIKSQNEVVRMRRSFQLISAQVPEELVQAFIDHQNWKVRAFSCALGEIDDGDFPFSTHECLLGQWLNSGGLARIPEHEIVSFETAHEQVHRLGFLALKEAKMRHPERIVDFLMEMELASDEVCRVLHDRIDEEFVRAASLDALTGLPNRCAFDAAFTNTLAFAKRHDFWVGVILLDIDFFKIINDTHGHLVGDQVLTELAAVLLEALRLEDNVYRWGGEEFAILALDKTSEGIENLAQRICARVADYTFNIKAATFGVTISCGAMSFEAQNTLPALERLRRVDEQLYQAKANGRNQVRYKKATLS